MHTAVTICTWGEEATGDYDIFVSTTREEEPIAKQGAETQLTCLQLLLQQIHITFGSPSFPFSPSIYLTNIAVGHGRSSYVRTLSMTSRARLFQPGSTTPHTSWCLTQHQTQMRYNLHKTRLHTTALRACLHLLTHKLMTTPHLDEDATGNMALCNGVSRLTAILTPCRIVLGIFWQQVANIWQQTASEWSRAISVVLLQHLGHSPTTKTMFFVHLCSSFLIARRSWTQRAYEHSAIFAFTLPVTSRRSWRNTLHRLAASSMRSLASGKRGEEVSPKSSKK